VEHCFDLLDADAWICHQHAYRIRRTNRRAMKARRRANKHASGGCRSFADIYTAFRASSTSRSSTRPQCVPSRSPIILMSGTGFFGSSSENTGASVPVFN
jgi:hypothetical protein